MTSRSSSSDGIVSLAKGVKYPFRSTHSLLWKNCQRVNAFANTMKEGVDNNKKRTAEAALSKMMHGNNCFETSNVDPTDTYRLPTDRRSLEKIKVLSTQQSMCIEFIKNEIILSKCTGSTTGNVFHIGGLPGAGKTATITSLIEDLADANMTAKGAVLLCSKTNAAKTNMFFSCVARSTPGKYGEYISESKFVTVNSGFAIPVIKSSADTEDRMIEDYTKTLGRKFIYNICLSDMIVMDEYTMTNVNEVLFIDCLLRASRGRPNVPFGGTPVIFLGDNRQNSSVVDRKNSSTKMIRGEGSRAIDMNRDTDKTGGRNVIDLISDALLKVLVTFLQSEHFITLFTRGCKIRKDALVDRYNYVKSLTDDSIARTDKVSNKRHRSSSLSSTPPEAVEENSSHVDGLELFDDSDFEEFMTEALGVHERPLTTFAARINKILSANGGGKEEGRGITKIVKITGYDVLREEALRAEIAHVDKYLTCNGERRKKMVNSTVEEILDFATLAMREIINTGRERFYILSGMTDVLHDCHVLSLVNEEIINIKLNFGKDVKCLDSTEIQARVSEGIEDERAERVSDAIMNAMFRTGDEPKGYVPLAEVFKFNLKKLMETLSRGDLTAQDLIDLANRAATGKVATDQAKQEQRRAVEYDSEGEEEEEGEGYYGSYEEEEQEITSRIDKPKEININDRTHDRVRKTVSFAQEYYKCYRLFSPITRARFWHTYLLARDVQTVNRFTSPVVSPFSKMSAGEKTVQFQDPYWLRALSLPINSSLDTSNMQSAYSAYLSMLSKTFIMSSQKRISVAHHSLGMMYSMSLFDMTVDTRALVDFRDITSTIPIGFVHKFLPVEYLQTIFPSIVSNFLVTTKAAISNEVRDVANIGSKGGGNLDFDLSIFNETVKKMGIDPSRQSKMANCVFIGSSILANIAMTKIHINMTKEKEINAEKTLLDKLLSGDKDATATEDTKKRRERDASSGPVGALALVKGHNQKNTITDLVEKTMAAALKKSTNYNQSAGSKDILHNELLSLRFETKFCVGGLDLSNIGQKRCITQQQKHIIMSKCNNAIASKKVFIDRLTDIKLINSTSIRDFMGHLLKLRDNVTRVQESIFFVGQSVTFTHSNRFNNSPYDCETMFYTTDTGFIEKIVVERNRLTIHVVLDKSSKVAKVSPGYEFFGPFVNGYHGAYVYYFPLTSSKALTIYSSQGQTFWRDVIVDITDASSQDIYVAVTRNANVLNLKIMSSSEKEMSLLRSIKTTMGRDKTKLFPLGGLRGVDASEAVDQLQKNRGIVVHDAYRMQTAVLDKRRDLVAAAQKFVMNLTNNNALAFNSSWMENTGKNMKGNGLGQRLEEIESFFFDPETPRSIIDYYNERTNKTLMQLFVCVQRSVLHYCMTSKCIKTPSMSALKAHRDGPSTADHVKFHPAFVNSPFKPETIETLFFDVAPHSFVTKVFQFYAHFLFLVYEQSHMCLSSFAFLPSASPTYNGSTRVKMDDKTREKVKENILFVPGEDALAYEPSEFTNAKDGYIRTRDRRAVVGKDFRADKLLERVSCDFVAEDPAMAAAAMEALAKTQKYNLRRAGKYCRKGEAVGLNTHGTVAIACDCENLSKSNLHITEIMGGEEWASFSYEANLYGMLTFMTKLAAASGVTKKISVIGDGSAALLPPATRLHGYSVELSPEILYSGQCDPMFKVQFLLHCNMLPKKDMTSGEGAEESLFGPEFENKLTKGREVKSYVKVIIMTETYGGASFANTTTSEVRNSLFMGLGKVRVEEKKTMTEANALINRFLKVKRFKRISFFLSVSI